MNNLTRKQKTEIIAFDKINRENAYAPNANRFYTYLTPERGGDVGVRTVAVKGHPKTGKVFVKEVMRASVDSNRMRVRDMVFQMIAGYCVDWSPEGVGREHCWSYEGEWGTEPYNPKRNNWKIQCRVVNRALLATSERFKYCSWAPACGHPLDYLKHYAVRPRIECLVKAGIGWLSQSRSFCAKLEADPALMSWVAKNREDLRQRQGNVTEIMYAYRHGIPLTEATRELQIRKEFDGLDLPKSFDRLAAWGWLTERNIPIYRYRPYLGLCQHYKLDLRDTKNSKPRNFESRMCELRDRKDAEDRAARIAYTKAERNKARKINAAIAGVRKQLEKVEKTKGPFSVYLPTSEADLRTEAKGMGTSCVWSYGNNIARGRSVVVFVRMPDAPDKPFVTVDYSPADREIVQCYATSNTKPDQPVLDFVYGKLQKTLNRLHKKAS